MRFRSLLAGILAITFSDATAQSPTYRYLYAFGDSLSDNGNLFRLIGVPGPPYWDGRFSNGNVRVEQLAEVLGIDLRDFAWVARRPRTCTTCR